MNKYINRFISGALMLLTVSVLFSCEEDDDLDMGYNRNFRPLSISVTAQATAAEISWKSTPNTSHYVLELSMDSLYDDCSSANSIFVGEDGSITSTTTTVSDLYSNTYYFVRVKSVSKNDTPDSKWAYYSNNNYRSFRTRSEQILNDVTSRDRGEDFITLSWNPELTVTHIIYFAADGNETRIDLESEDKEAGTYTITGLTPATSYTFQIWNNISNRGTRVVSTTNPAPSANVRKYLYAGDVLTQADLDALVSEGSVTYIMEAGMELTWETLDETTGEMAAIIIPDGLSVTFFGGPGGDKPTIKTPKTIEIDGNHNFVSFENVALVNSGSSYLINEGNVSTLETLSFIDCTFTGYDRSIVRLKDNAAIRITNLAIDNCIITNQGAGNYACFYWNNAAYTVENFSLRNTTMNTALHNVMDFRNSNMSSIDIENCTFYNIVGSTRYFLDCQNIAPTIRMSNLIFAKANTAVITDGAWTSTSRGLRSNSTPTISEVYFTADFVFGSNAFSPTYNYTNVSEDLFADPANGNFQIKDASFGGRNNAGDPRWYMTEE